MNKILVIDKEKDYTSRDVVNIISKHFKTKKVGHFGTLDPLATGVLVVGIGCFTKLGNVLVSDDKEYVCDVLVGSATDTYDVTGNIISERPTDKLDFNYLKDVLNSFIGTYEQEVPIYSAVKVDGKKLYEYARSGMEVVLPKKEVTIKEIELLDIYKKDNNLYFKFKSCVSKGTYIRSLVNDISKVINIPLCMSDLRRIRQDRFMIEDANKIEDILSNNYKEVLLSDIISCDVVDIPFDLEKIILNYGLIKYSSDKDFVIFRKGDKDIVLYGKYEKDEDYMKPYIILKED